MMKRSLIFFVFGTFFIGIVVSAVGQGFKITQPTAIGGGLVVTHQDGLGESTAAGPGLELFLKYNISPKVFLSAGTGIYTVTDETLKMKNFRTTLFPTVEVKAGYNFIQGQKFVPFAFVGLHAFGWKSKIQYDDLSFSSDTYYDGGAFFGAGFEYTINDQWAFNFSGDYRYIFTAKSDPKPKYWVAKSGVSYSLKPEGKIKGEEIEYPLDPGELVLDDLFKEEDVGEATEEDALALLFEPEKVTSDSQPEGVESEGVGAKETTFLDSYKDVEVREMMARIQDLKDEMEHRTRQVEDLQAQVRANEKAIAEVTGRVAGEYTGESFGVVSPENFKANYETGLQKFYVKQFTDAIRIFRTLLTSNPDHRLASNCQYWIGESYNAMGEYRKAIDAFNAVLRYRSSYKFDDALLMNGLCYMKLGDRVTARENFQRLVSQFPESEYAPKAMRYLGRL